MVNGEGVPEADRWKDKQGREVGRVWLGPEMRNREVEMVEWNIWVGLRSCFGVVWLRAQVGWDSECVCEWVFWRVLQLARGWGWVMREGDVMQGTL